MAGKAESRAGWNFDNSYLGLPEIFYSRLNPTPVRSPELVVLNEALAAELGLDAEVLRGADGVAVLAGNKLPGGAAPLAQAYAGHQFGHFTMLGDGRALLLGEQITPQGHRFDIQLKGAGRTPYSRRGDGRAALGPMLREYIISEAMYALGIPSTRSLAVVGTGEVVRRESALAGAVLTRVAASHIRVGTFEYISHYGKPDDVRALADYTIKRHFAHIGTGADGYLLFLREVIRRQAELIAGWMLVGFVHGVMNTDNMALSAETIDYGPCAFMDSYDPAVVFSSIDTYGRYAYGNQPGMALWNLARLAETLLPLLHEDSEKAVQLAQDTLSEFEEVYELSWLAGMRAKLGLFDAEEDDESLVHDLLDMMQKFRADYTNTFRALTLGRPEQTAMHADAAFVRWLEAWQARLDRQHKADAEVRQLMRSANPAVIPRNFRVEQALEAAVRHGDYSVMERLLRVLASPFAYSPEHEEYTEPPGPAEPAYRTFCGT